jgi:hypothetical protein
MTATVAAGALIAYMRVANDADKLRNMTGIAFG